MSLKVFEGVIKSTLVTSSIAADQNDSVSESKSDSKTLNEREISYKNWLDKLFILAIANISRRDVLNVCLEV